MLKLLALFLDLLSVLFALLAPIAIVHWLLGILAVPQLAGFVQVLAGFFQPMNGLLESVVGSYVPHVAYEGRDITVTQGILGFLFTLVFFLLAGLATATRGLDKKQAVASSLKRSHARMQQQAVVQAAQDRKTSSATRILIEILYPFDEMPEGSRAFAGFAEGGGRLISSRPEAWVLMFESCPPALDYAIAAGTALRRHYATLRPMDPQPPFRMALHTSEPTDTATREGVGYLHLILRYAGENQIVFSQALQEGVTLQAPAKAYDIQSMGLFDLGTQGQQEIFRLFYQSRQPHTS